MCFQSVYQPVKHVRRQERAGRVMDQHFCRFAAISKRFKRRQHGCPTCCPALYQKRGVGKRSKRMPGGVFLTIANRDNDRADSRMPVQRAVAVRQHLTTAQTRELLGSIEPRARAGSGGDDYRRDSLLGHAAALIRPVASAPAFLRNNPFQAMACLFFRQLRFYGTHTHSYRPGHD